MSDIAQPEEILQFMTDIMRGTLTEVDKKGEESPPKVSERARAAELLAKRYGLFSEAESQDAQPSAIADEIRQALADYLEKKQPDHGS